MRGLEGMTDEFDIAIWTATQGNRDSIVTEVVTTNQMGGSIKKAQIGHIVISVGKTLEQKENNLATVTLLKSRIGPDGIVFQNCLFNNEMLEINTDTQNTLLGHKTEKAEQLKQHQVDVFKEFVQRKKEKERILRGEDVESQEISPSIDFQFEKNDGVNDGVNEGVNDGVNDGVNEISIDLTQLKSPSVPLIERDDNVTELTPTQRAAKVYKENKAKKNKSIK
jgi:hypothetical protein